MAYFLIQEYKLTDCFGKCLVTANCLSALTFLSLIEDEQEHHPLPHRRYQVRGLHTCICFQLEILDILGFNFYMYMHIHTHRYLCLYTYIYYIFIDTYIYVYIYIYIYTCVCVCSQSCLTLCDPIDCSQLGFSVHGILQAWNTGTGCHFLLQGIFPTQRSNPCLLHLQAGSLPLCHLRIPYTYTHINKHLHKQICTLHRQLKSPRREFGGKWAEGAGG